MSLCAEDTICLHRKYQKSYQKKPFSLSEFGKVLKYNVNIYLKNIAIY